VLHAKYENSLFLINCGGDDENPNVGTGFLIDSRLGLILTAHHVIKRESHYDCTTQDGTIAAYPMGDMCGRLEVEYVDGDYGLDVALLRLKKSVRCSFFAPF
jgi:S1-C subfamily serine protease